MNKTSKTKKSKWPKLPVAFKRKCVKALRSGEYKQGRAMLYNSCSHTFCCMGVAGVVCEIPLSLMAGGGAFTKDRAIHAKGLPTALVDRRRCDDGFTPLIGKLVNLNDNEKEPFPRIADWIEKNL